NWPNESTTPTAKVPLPSQSPVSGVQLGAPYRKGGKSGVPGWLVVFSNQREPGTANGGRGWRFSSRRKERDMAGHPLSDGRGMNDECHCQAAVDLTNGRTRGDWGLACSAWLPRQDGSPPGNAAPFGR